MKRVFREVKVSACKLRRTKTTGSANKIFATVAIIANIPRAQW